MRLGMRQLKILWDRSRRRRTKGGTVMGTGHNMLITMPDGKMYTVYHARMQADPSKRVVFMDQVTIEDGKLEVNGPTTSEQKIAY